ncbi:ABC transporter permease [Corallococcus sp. CA053C]|uniref:ABC transporter permease n=1 Tax=Corallococcus sp. CA053C TaxID=2316732 RepID=UPI000EA20258|nr:ABC transporter permease [Corallococcus sp. CA053C]RKH08233.1 ABC transporter permease [Corallococcus sp. CA053C]
MSHLVSDLRFAARMLLKQRGFTAVILLLLALGIGANSALFSVVYAALLSPLPFPQPERLVLLSETLRRNGDVEPRPFSYPDFRDWKAQARTFAAMGAFGRTTLTLGKEGEAERVEAELVSDGYFEALGTTPLMGRTFQPEENSTPDAHAVAVVSHRLWKRKLSGARDVLGRSLLLNGRTFTIVGVMPEGFGGWEAQSQLWVPMMMVSLDQGAAVLDERGERWHSAVARLAPGATQKGAQEELDAIATRLAEMYPNTNAQRGARLTPAHEAVFGALRPALLMLWGAVGFVLLSVCVNVANLLLARAVMRQKEMAVRVALGASRTRLIQQVMAESLLLSVMGGALGLLLSVWIIDLLRLLMPEDFSARLHFGLDAPVILFNVGCTLGAGVLVALMPALKLSQPSMLTALKERAAQSAAGKGRVRAILVATNVALAVVLLVGAGLMARSFQRLNAVDAGFVPDGVLTLMVDLPAERYPPDALASFQKRLQERLDTLSLFQAISLASDVPLGSSSSAGLVGVTPEAEGSVEERIRTYRHAVNPGFFSALKVPLKRGRVFSSTDIAGAQRTVVISEALERRMWPRGGALGRQLNLGKGIQAEVVGVVGNVRFRDLTGEPAKDPDIYFPLAQAPRKQLAVLGRTSADRTLALGAIRSAIREIDPSLVPDNVMDLESYVAAELLPARLNVLLLGTFAMMALVLASIGLYGLIAYVVGQRKQEIAIRMALGATAPDILRLILRQGMAPVVAGVAVGIPLALALSRLVASQLFGLSPTDPTTYLSIAALLLTIAAMSCYLPARRGTRVDPIIALRAE